MSKLTKTQIANLEKLAALLEKRVPPPKFDMASFLENPELEIGFCQETNSESIAIRPSSHLYSHCGTVACAVGHGPLIGIAKKKDENWFSYAARVFGIDANNIDGSLEFDFLFGGEWTEYDNTPHGAAARIRIFLENGCEVPEETLGYYGIDFDVALSLYSKENEEEVV